MKDAAGTATASPAPATATAPRRSWRRRLVLASVLIAAIVALLALLLVVAPRHIARLVADNYLSGMNIDVDGVKTIDIDLLKGEFSMGPVAFHSGSAEPGSIGLLGIDLSLRDLLEKQALLRRVVVRDVDVAVRQTADGQILINGIPLRQMLAEEAADEPAPATTSSRSPWGTGVDDLRVRNALVTFTNREGGMARVNLEHLDLRGFRSWEPDQPGTFVLSGGVNGIDVNIFGTARPFAEKITTNVEFGIDGIDLASIEEYTGSLGFDPTKGTMTLYGRSAATLFPQGHMEGTGDANLVLANVDAARLGGMEVKLDQGSIALQGAYGVGIDGGFSFTGRGEGKLNEAYARPADGAAFSLAAAALNLSDVDLAVAGGGVMTLSVHPTLELENPALEGPTEAKADRLNLDVVRLAIARGDDGVIRAQAAKLEDQAAAPASVGRLAVAAPSLRAPLGLDAASFNVDLAALTLEMSGGKMLLTTEATLQASGTNVATVAQAGQAATEVRVAKLTAPLGPLTLSSEEGRLRLAGSVNAAAEGVAVALAAPAQRAPAAEPRRLAAATLNLSLPKMVVEAAGGATSVSSAGSLDLGRPEVSLPGIEGQPPATLAATTGRLILTDVQAARTGADIRLEGGIRGELTGIDGAWGGTRQAPAAPQQIRGRGRRPANEAASAAEGGILAVDRLTLGLTPLDVRTVGDRLTLAGSVSTELVGLKATVPAGPREAPWQLALAQLRAGFSGLDGELLPVLTTGVGKLDVTAGGFVAEQAAPSLPRAPANNRTRIAVQDLRLAPGTLGVRTLPDRTAVTGSANAQLAGIDVQLPRTDQNPAAAAGIRSVRAEISEFTADQAGSAFAWSVRTNVLADQLTNRTEEGRLASLDLRSLSIGELTADHRRKMAVERVVLDQLRAFLTREYLFASATQQSRPKEAVEAVQEAAKEGWKFQLGSLGVTDSAQIKLRDTTTDPNTNVTIDMQSLQILNLNTGDPAQRTQVRVEATINQFTELGLAGWAAPFGGQPDFDLNARLRRLELPTLSPYAAQAIGLNVESGRLSLDVNAAAQSGNLDGLVDLTLRDLNFSALSAADAEQLSASVGVPVETIVGLLQDDQGRIRLSLPISGNLANPAFDPTDAIRQALTGALQAAVLAPFQLAFAPVALIAKAAGAGGTGQLGLQPIPFAPGIARLDSTAQDMAVGLARVLQERDRLQIKVCGRATASDLTAALRADGAPEGGPGRDAAAERLAPELWSLAGERTARVRDALITQGGAQPRQVGECRILYDPTDTGPPRVEVTL